MTSSAADNSGSAPLTLCLAGCGKMGGAMLRGWLDSNIAGQCAVVDPSGTPGDPSLAEDDRVTVYDSVNDLPAGFTPDAVIMAVKPQIMDKALPGYADLVRKSGAVLISIAAGKTVSYFENHLGTDTAIVRAMPNTPAAIGKGVLFAVPNAQVTDAQKDIARRLLSASGQFTWFDDEELMNAATAVSGSGPAYVFLLIETLAKAGEAHGLDADTAMKLARQTVIGSAALVEASPDIPAATLRENVTSPGGTTLEALKVLMDEDGIQPLFNKAIGANIRRSRELGG